MTTPMNPQGVQPTIPTYVMPAVLAAFLFPFTGVFAVWYSTRTMQALGVGDFTNAQQWSNRTKMLMIVSFVLFVPVAFGFGFYQYQSMSESTSMMQTGTY